MTSKKIRRACRSGVVLFVAQVRARHRERAIDLLEGTMTTTVSTTPATRSAFGALIRDGVIASVAIVVMNQSQAQVEFEASAGLDQRRGRGRGS